MKPGGGKQKGSAFEREICKKLSLWISDNERDSVFWRSAMSGGRATVGFKKGVVRNTQVGDISSIDPIGNKLTDKYVVECKFYKNIHLQSMLFGKPKENSIYEFWITLNNQAKKAGKYPLLIIKQNGMPTLIGITHGNLQKVLKEDYDIIPIAIFSYMLPVCYLYEFEYILNLVDPAILEFKQ